jgi:hypothetical protein
LKNFNFSLLTAFYIFIVGWFFTRSVGNPGLFLIFTVATSPILWVAFYMQGRRIPDFRESELGSPSLFSHFLALVCAVSLFFLVLKMRTGTRFGPMQLFGNLTIGWTAGFAAELLAIELVMTVCAATIWSGYRFRESRPGTREYGIAKLFFAGTRESHRFLIYLYLISFFWTIGMAATYVFFGKEYGIERLFIVMSRATVPVVALLTAAVLRIRVHTPRRIAAALPVVLWVCVIWAIGYLIFINLDWQFALVFLVPQLATAAVFFGGRYFTVSKTPAAAAPEQPLEKELEADEEVH